MPTPTKQLQELLSAKQINRLLTNKIRPEDFRDSAMALVRLGADISLQANFKGRPTLLHIFARTNVDGKNNKVIIEMVNLYPEILASRDQEGRTALQSLLDGFFAQECSFDDFKQTAMILARLRADITTPSFSNAHPLMHVLVRENENGANNDEIAELVVLNPNVLTSRDNYGRTPLRSLLDAFHSQECSLETFKRSAMLLARSGANITVSSTCGLHASVLHVLAIKNKEGINNKEIIALIDLNPQVVNILDGYGRTAVQILLFNNPEAPLAIIKVMLSIKNLQLKDDEGATLLHAASFSGNLAALQYFASRELNLNSLTTNKETLLHYAVSSGNAAMVQWLIDQQQIDIDASDRFGETALHYAVRKNNLELVKLLVRNKASITIRNVENQKASELAREKGYHSLIGYLSNPRVELLDHVQAMHTYGIALQRKGILKGQVAIDLAAELTAITNQFFAQAQEQQNFKEFQSRFLAILNSKKQEIITYRVAWKTIISNISIALTGLGLLFIAGKLIHSKRTEGRALFFFQKPKTTSEEKVNNIEHALCWIPENNYSATR